MTEFDTQPGGIAIITPVYNRKNFLADCVDSVATLKKLDYEHLIVDDGSTDGTKKVVQGIKNSRVKKIFLPRNRGQAHARNIALKKTTADKIFFLDSDDVLIKSGFVGLYQASRATAASNWVYGDILQIDKDGRYLIGGDYYGHSFKKITEVLYAMYLGEHFFQQSSVFDRKTLIKIGGFDPKLRMAEDFELATRLLLKGILPKYVPGAVCLRRIHGRNLSAKHIKDPLFHRQDLKKLFKKHGLSLSKRLSRAQVKNIKARLFKNGK